MIKNRSADHEHVYTFNIDSSRT